MSPDEAAALVKEELVETLALLMPGGGSLRVISVEPPPRPATDLGPDTCFQLLLSSSKHQPASVRVALPSTLAIGYLADEEAAVDEWRNWVHQLLERYA